MDKDDQCLQDRRRQRQRKRKRQVFITKCIILTVLFLLFVVLSFAAYPTFFKKDPASKGTVTSGEKTPGQPQAGSQSESSASSRQESSGAFPG